MTLIVGTNNSEVLNGTGQGDVIYGLGGLIVPFVGIKLIDWILVALHLA